MYLKAGLSTSTPHYQIEERGFYLKKTLLTLLACVASGISRASVFSAAACFGLGFTTVKRKKQENYFKDKVFIFTVKSLILYKYSPGLLIFLELY